MNALNEHLFLWLNLGRQDPAWLMDLARFGSTVWPTAVLILVLAAIVVGPGRWRLAALHMLLAILLAWLIVRGISTLWPMPRPFVLGLGEQWLAKEPSASFPSSHASIAWAISAAAVWWVRHPLLITGFCSARCSWPGAGSRWVCISRPTWPRAWWWACCLPGPCCGRHAGSRAALAQAFLPLLCRCADPHAAPAVALRPAR